MIDTKLLRQKILDLAIRGKLVPQDPTDEPASELLKKIKAEKDALVKAGKIKKDKHESHIFKGDDNRYYETIDGKTADITDEIPFDLPDGWAWVRLSMISEFDLGKTLDRQKNKGNYHKYLRSVNVLWGKIDLSDVKEMRFEDTELERYSINKGDLLICEGGDVGRCAVWDKEFVFYYQNALHRVRFFQSCSPLFYQFVMMFFENTGLLKEISQGVTIKHLTKNTLNSMFFPLPPLTEQQRIVEQIETLLKYVDVIDADAETLENAITLAKQKILDLAIRGKLVPQDPTDEPASELLKKIRAEKDALVKAGKLKKDKHESFIFKSDDNCYYEQLNGKTADITVDIPFNLPPKWCWCRLKNIIDLLSGRDLTPQNYNDKGGRYPYITGASNFDKSKLIINRWTDAPEVISIPNDVLLTCKGTVGEIAINSVGEIHIARQIMALRPSPSIIKEYLATVLQSMINHIKSEANGLIPGISRDVILELLIPIPPLAEQQRIVQAIAQYNSILELISK